jgi:hypothetical protein
MYCKCNNRQPVKQTAMGKEFTVCSKRLGGCGEEINDTINFPEVEDTFLYMRKEIANVTYGKPFITTTELRETQEEIDKLQTYPDIEEAIQELTNNLTYEEYYKLPKYAKEQLYDLASCLNRYYNKFHK